jgi:hypothetical protein
MGSLEALCLENGNVALREMHEIQGEIHEKTREICAEIVCGYRLF